MLSTAKKHLTYLVIVTFPIMSLVDITPTLFMNLSLADVFVLLLGIVWLIDIRRFSLKRHFPYFWYFLLYVLLLWISNIYNIHTPVNDTGINGIIAESIKMITNAIFFFAAYNAVNENGIETKKIFMAWMIGLYIFMLYGLYAQGSRLSGVSPWMFNRVLGNHSRLLGTLTDANAAALYLSVSFFVTLAGKRYGTWPKVGRLWLNITAVLALLCIGLTMSRGGMIGFLCGFLVWAVYNVKTYIRYIYIVPAALCLLLFVLVIDTRFFSNNILRQFTSRVEDATSDNGMLQTRLNLSLASVRMGMDHPLLGIGRGNFPLNSEPYLLEQGVDWEGRKYTYINMVPHNTVAGVFAEMGVPGLSAFLSLFILMFIKTLRNKAFDWPFKVLVLALWASVFVQSLAISLENARVFWIITGLLLCFADKKILFRKADVLKEMPTETEQGSIVKKKFSLAVVVNIGVFVVSSLLCVVFYAYVGTRYTNGTIDVSGTVLSIPFEAEQAGQYTLRYWVSTPPDTDMSAEETPPMTVSIRNTDTGEIVSSVQYFARANGYANLQFDVIATESLVIDFEGREVSNINDVKIMRQNASWTVLAGVYPLLPQSLYDYCQRKAYLVTQTADTKAEKVYYRSGVLEEDEWTVFGGAVRYKGVEISQTVDGATQFVYTLDCVGVATQDYIFAMHLYVDDINRLNDHRRASGSIICDQRTEIPMDQWQVGDEYKHTYVIDLKAGDYRMFIGVYRPAVEGTPGGWVYTATQTNGVNAGWFSVGEP